MIFPPMSATRAIQIANAMLRENEDPKSPRYNRLSNQEHQAIAKLMELTMPEAIGIPSGRGRRPT